MAVVDVPDPYLNHINEAWHQLAAGRRPTADSVLDVVRGSKATAVAAMQFFWSTYVPSIVSGRTVDDVPDPVMRLAGQIWAKAVRLAADSAEASFAAERAAFEDAKRALDNERDGFKTVESRHKAEITDLKHELSVEHERMTNRLLVTHEGALAKVQANFESGQAEIAGLKQIIDELHKSVEAEKDRCRKAEQAAKDEGARVSALEAALRKAEQDNAVLKDESQALAQNVKDANDALVASIARHQEHTAELARIHESALERQRSDHAAELDRLSQLHGNAEMRLKLDVDALKVQLKKASAKPRKARAARNE